MTPEDLELVISRTRHKRYAELTDPDHPDHDARYLPIVARMAAEYRGEAIPRRPSRIDVVAPAPILPPREDGRIRVGIISPGCYTGGAERWMATLMSYTCPDVIHWQGIAIAYEKYVDGPMLAEFKAHCPVGIGFGAMDDLYGACDVVLIWGMWGGDQRQPIRPRHVRTAIVSHGVGEWTAAAFALAGNADAWVAVSEAALGPIPEPWRSRAVVLPNGVDRRRLVARRGRAEVRAGWGVPEGAFVPLYLGRLSAEKNPLAFVDGVAELAKSRSPIRTVGVMAGDGLDAESVRARAKGLGPGTRIVFAGVRDDVGDVLRASDVLVMPSFEEASSLALLEAWTLGVPVVSTPVGILREPAYAALARLVPASPTGADIAGAILADRDDPAGTAERARQARRVARETFGGAAFGRRWTEFLVGLARPESPRFAGCGCGSADASQP